MAVVLILSVGNISTPYSLTSLAGSVPRDVSQAAPQQQGADADPDLDIDLRFEQLGIQDGLTMSLVQSVTQDPRGFLWIGTGAGLNQYDGYQVTLHEVNPDDPNQLAGESITSLYPDSQDNLWIGTDLGLVRFHLRSGELTQYRYEPDDPRTITQGQVNAILEDEFGNLWIGTTWGLSRLDPESETFTRFLPENNISDLYLDSRGVIWIASNLGLISWHPERERFTVYQHDPEDPHSLSNSMVTAIDGDSDGNLWVGTVYGLNRFNSDSGRFNTYLLDMDDPQSLSDNNVSDVLHDSRGRTWVATVNGLNLYDPELDGFYQFRHDPATPSSLKDNVITTLFEDRSGVIWIGTLRGGLNKLSDVHNRFQLFPPPSPGSGDARQTAIRKSLQSTLITEILQDQQGDLWIGTLINGLFRLNHETGLFEQFTQVPTTPASLSGNGVNEIFEDDQGRLWFGTDRGLDLFDRQSKTFESQPTFSGDPVGGIAQDSAGDMWISSTSGLFRMFLQDGELLVEKSPFAQEEPEVNQLFFDSQGVFWIATNNGVFVLNPGETAFTHFTPDPQNPGGLAGQLAFSIFEDRQGEIWIGTIFGGLNRYDPGTRSFSSYTEREGLPGQWVSCILEDDLGNLWLGTNRGLARFTPQYETFRHYDQQDGVQGGEFFSCTGTEQGELFFGGFQGINAFYPQEITQNEFPPLVGISQVYLFNQPLNTLDWDQPLEFNYNQNFLSFDYTAFDFNVPEKNQYAYMLEGLDQEWNLVGARRHAEYPDLNPGQYTFRVKAANSDGIWNEEGAAVKISIRPPFWETTWFQLLGLILITGAIYGGYRLQVRRLHARSRELQAEVAERTAELNQRTLEAEQRQAEIEALYRADEELYRYLHLDHVLHALLETALDILDAEKGLLVVWDGDHSSLVLNSSIGYSPETIKRLLFIPGQGNLGSAAVNGEPIIVEDTTQDPLVQDVIREVEHIRTAVLVPIKIETEIFGVFSVDYVQPHTVTNQELRLLEALAQRTALAIENARLYEQAQDLAALEERNRLARDLHDSVTQSLFGASMFADTAEHHLSAGEVEKAAQNISKMRSSTQAALGEMRLMIYELRPPVLEEEGLAAALISRLETVEQRSGVLTQLEIEEIQGLTSDQEQQIYSIAIEALNNSLKHAQAEKISVRLSQDEDKIDLQIADDGVGFDLASGRESGGLGLVGMQERAARLGAKLTIDTAPGGGTHLQLAMEIE